MKLLIAIDGACRRNGKPDCVASGGIFGKCLTESGALISCFTDSAYEIGSTNQRGELMALLGALEAINQYGCEAQIVTDSEYLFNAMTKQWYKNWQHNNWLTRDGYEVKNRDLWEQIAARADRCERMNNEVIYYHIKGHCIPFGAVTARNLLLADTSGLTLYKHVCEKFDAVAPTKVDILKYASDLSVKNNGFPLDLSSSVLREWVTLNVVADAVATKAVDDTDSCLYSYKAINDTDSRRET